MCLITNNFSKILVDLSYINSRKVRSLKRNNLKLPGMKKIKTKIYNNLGKIGGGQPFGSFCLKGIKAGDKFYFKNS